MKRDKNLLGVLAALPGPGGSYLAGGFGWGLAHQLAATVLDDGPAAFATAYVELGHYCRGAPTAVHVRVARCAVCHHGCSLLPLSLPLSLYGHAHG